MTVTSDLSRFAKKTVATFDKMKSKRTFTWIGRLAIELIKEHVRKGYGLEKHNTRLKRLKGLSKKYKAWRKKAGRKLLGPHAKPSFSNLNLTGEMVDSLTIMTIKKDRITIAPSKFKHARSNKTNWQIANYHHNGSGRLPKRRFNFLSANELIEVVNAFSGALTKELKNARISKKG